MEAARTLHRRGTVGGNEKEGKKGGGRARMGWECVYSRDGGGNLMP